MTELDLRDLREAHRSRARPPADAVRGTDLALRSGELLGPPGPSGCGRSTAPRMIAGLTSGRKQRVSPADVLLLDEPLSHMPVAHGRTVVVGARPEDLRLTGPELRLAFDERVGVTADPEPPPCLRRRDRSSLR